MSIELKHLEGLIRLCETTDPAKLRQIRIKLSKQLSLAKLSPRDDVKLRELWAQLNCGEPYPEGISGGSDYSVLTIAAIALLILVAWYLLSGRPPQEPPARRSHRLPQEPPAGQPVSGVPNAPILSKALSIIDNVFVYPIHEQNSGAGDNYNSVCAAYSALYASKIFSNEPLDYLNHPFDFSKESPVTNEVRGLYASDGFRDDWWASPALPDTVLSALVAIFLEKNIVANKGIPIGARMAHHKGKESPSGNFFDAMREHSYIILATVDQSEPEKADSPRPEKADSPRPEKAAPNRRQGFTFAIVHSKGESRIYVIDTHVKSVKINGRRELLKLMDRVTRDNMVQIFRSSQVHEITEPRGIIAILRDGTALDRFLETYYLDPRESNYTGISAQYEYITMGSADVNFWDLK